MYSLFAARRGSRFRPVEAIFKGSDADCPRGTLDKQYCDRDGDLTADLPTDPSEWVDPDSLIFAYIPVEDPAVYKSVWAGFIDHMS